MTQGRLLLCVFLATAFVVGGLVRYASMREGWR